MVVWTLVTSRIAQLAHSFRNLSACIPHCPNSKHSLIQLIQNLPDTFPAKSPLLNWIIIPATTLVVERNTFCHQRANATKHGLGAGDHSFSEKWQGKHTAEANAQTSSQLKNEHVTLTYLFMQCKDPRG